MEFTHDGLTYDIRKGFPTNSISRNTFLSERSKNRFCDYWFDSKCANRTLASFPDFEIIIATADTSNQVRLKSIKNLPFVFRQSQ